MPRISVELDDQMHRLAKIRALTSVPPTSLMGYVRTLIERDLRKSGERDFKKSIERHARGNG
jgi:CRISPR/Cas system CSM-associated protein Csm3 (group 7 of RAMP superfamily)